MSIDKKTIEKRLGKLEQVVKLLEQYKKISEENFLIDFTVNSAAQYNLILGIEIIVDIGNHILSEKYQVSSDDYGDVIKNLGKYEIVPAKFAKDNVNMLKFSNLIVHHYGEVDMKQVYRNFQKAPDIFRKFAQYYINFLEKN